MTHEDFESIAALDAVGAATPDEVSSLEQHLASCESCRRARDEFAEAATLLAQELEPVAPPPEVREHVVRRSRKRTRSKTTSSTRTAAS
jgi:predicted anti-sigma-YlaC factor YlaD